MLKFCVYKHKLPTCNIKIFKYIYLLIKHFKILNDIRYIYLQLFEILFLIRFLKNIYNVYVFFSILILQKSINKPKDSLYNAKKITSI